MNIWQHRSHYSIRSPKTQFLGNILQFYNIPVFRVAAWQNSNSYGHFDVFRTNFCDRYR